MNNHFKNIGLVFVVLVAVSSSVFAESKKSPPPAIMFDINQTVIKQAVIDGVEADDVVEAMQSKAIELNMKLVAHQPLYKELQARGVESGRLEIFQFCNPGDADKMVKFNPIFAAYMPCRIALVEDQEGKLWVMMLNLDMLINSTPLPPEVKVVAEKVNNTLMQILDAAATGEF
ncbi:MAG: DUF302 domain-containing protein [Gammaproteobacteria bacterium]